VSIRKDALTGLTIARTSLEHALGETVTPFAEEPVGPMRQARMDLRVLLNQGDGTFETTNAIADDLARAVVSNLRSAGYLFDLCCKCKHPIVKSEHEEGLWLHFHAPEIGHEARL
jgi:hypothetical protein